MTGARIQYVPRENDDFILKVLGIRFDGHSFTDIAIMLDITKNKVAGIIKRIKDGDIQHCGPGVAWAYVPEVC